MYKEFLSNLPDIEEGKRIAVAFCGDINSSLLAKVSAEKYGQENVVLITFTNLFDNKEDYRSSSILINSINALNYLPIPERNHYVYHTFEFDKSNKLSYMQAVEEKISSEFPDIDTILFGLSKISFDIEPLLGKQPFEILDYIKENPDEMRGVVKAYHVDSEEDWLKEISYDPKTPETYHFLRTSNKVISPFKQYYKSDIVSAYRESEDLLLLENSKNCNSFTGAAYIHKQCGICYNCQVRKDVHAECGLVDKTVYAID